jgi:hypothetical protein
MKKLVVAFIILTGILFAGIFIMIKPSNFASQLESAQTTPNIPLSSTNVPRGIILIGSILVIMGLVGLSILGFRIFKDFENTATKAR